MPFKAVIFDMDGTLLDTLSDLGNSMNSVLESHGYPVHELEAYKYMVGKGVEYLVKSALPQTINDAESVKGYIEEYHTEYDKNWKSLTKPYDGILDLLEILYSYDLKLAILSNKPHDYTEICARQFLPFDKFEVILGHRPGTATKPDPAGAIEITKQIMIPPEQILYLGDTDVDMKTAVAAGMYPVGVLWGFRSREELIKNGAKILLEKPQELLKLVEEK